MYLLLWRNSRLFPKVILILCIPTSFVRRVPVSPHLCLYLLLYVLFSLIITYFVWSAISSYFNLHSLVQRLKRLLPMWETRVRSLVGKIPWRRKWQPTPVKIPWRRKWQPIPVFLSGESHGQRSLVGYSPQGRKESYRTEQLHFHFHLQGPMGSGLC